MQKGYSAVLVAAISLFGRSAAHADSQTTCYSYGQAISCQTQNRGGYDPSVDANFDPMRGFKQYNELKDMETQAKIHQLQLQLLQQQIHQQQTPYSEHSDEQ